jgi:hypothetical protein
MALNPSGAISLAGPSAGQSIAVELGLSATAAISLNDTVVRTLAQVPSGVIVMPTDFYGKSSFTPTQKGIFAYGEQSTVALNVSNLVSDTGVVASDTPGVGTNVVNRGAASYGGDKAIFAYGNNRSPNSPTIRNISNLVSNTGVVATESPGVGTARSNLAAAAYGGDKAICGFGNTPTVTNLTNLVSNTGVVATDTPGVGTARFRLAAATYGGSNDKAIFGYGSIPPAVFQAITNLVSNTGVVASDTPGVGTARQQLAAAGYGGDKAIFGFGVALPLFYNITNLVSNTGVVASDTPGVGTARQSLSATNYGGDKGIFAFGRNQPAGFAFGNMTNLISNTGVVASDTPSVATARYNGSGAGYSFT